MIPPRPRLNCKVLPRLRGQIRPRSGRGLEVELQPDLQNARVEGRGELAEVTGTEVVADLVELRVVPDVEGFQTQFEAAATGFAQ